MNQGAFQALKMTKALFDDELKGIEVNDKQWEECYACVSNAIEQFQFAGKEEKGKNDRKGKGYAGSGGFASGRTTGSK